MRKLLSCDIRTKFRVILFVVVFVLAGISYAGEKVAKDDGLGWDGEMYFDTIQNFSDKILDKGYDQYGIHRILPYGLLNIYFKMIGDTNVTTNQALWAAGVLSFLAILASMFFFFGISNVLNWKLSTEVIAFSSLFFSYPILKVAGYYILLSDIYGFLLGLMLVYYFLSNKKIALVVCGILGAFIWPVASACALVLVFFPQQPLPLRDRLEGWDQTIYRLVIVSLGLLPLFYFFARGLYHNSWTEGLYVLSRLESIPPVAIGLTVVSCLCSCLYLFYMMRPFKVSLSETLPVFKSWKTWAKLGGFVVCYMLVTLVCKLLANDSPGAVPSSFDLFQRVMRASMGLPFASLENFVIYFGPCILLAFIYWEQIVPYITEKGMGYLLVVAMGVFLSLGPEARSAVLSLPFVIIATMQYVDTINLKKWVPASFAAMSLLFSRFWFHLNGEGMAEALSWENYDNYLDFPAQRYFMSTGNWQSPTMYVVFMAILIPLFILFVVGRKKGWFVEKSN